MVSERRVPDWLTRWDYTHRGLHSEGVPENSLAAAKAAIAAGMGIECDVQRSSDGHPMVFHDWDLERLAGVRSPTEDMPADELERLKLVGTQEGPVRLSKFLEVVAGQAPLLIEIKSKPGYEVDLTCAQVSEVLEGYNGDHAVMSFDPRVSNWFARHNPGRVRGLVCTDTLDHGFLGAWRAAGALEQAQADFLAMDIRDLPNAICSLWRETGKPLLSWTIRSCELRDKAVGLIDAAIAEGEGIA